LSDDAIRAAISTVLNNPRKRQAPPAAHSHLPTVPPADLPRVRRKDFEGYLRDIAPEWERFERARLSVDESEDSSATQLQSPTTPTAPHLFRSTSTHPIPSLDIVPQVFFDPAFNLGNPATFALVTEQSSGPGTGQDIDPASISHSLPLLEKLSHYADTVEQHLVREVQARSSSFFEALGNLHDLQSESERCLRRIGELKEMLKDVDEKQAKRGLEIVRSEAQIEDMVKVEEGVKVVKDIHDMKGISQGLVAAGEWGDALNVIENIQHLWDHSSTESSTARPPPTTPAPGFAAVAESPLPSPARTPFEAAPPIPLAFLRAFSSLPQDLRALTLQISTFLSGELVGVLRIDIGSRIEMGDTRMSEDDLTFRDQIRPLLLGLLRTNGVRDAIVGWRDVVMADVRASVKHVGHFLSLTQLYG
jgi:vacuolar protein sorting-associated protein 54